MISIHPTEPISHIDQFKTRLGEGEVRVDFRNIGDYSFHEAGGIGFERKTAGDFKRSLPKIHEQCLELADNYKHPFLALEGTYWEFVTECNGNPNILDGALASITCRTGVPHFFVLENLFADRILMYRDKLTDGKVLIREPIRPQASTSDWQLHIVKSFPKIGTKKAEKLLELSGGLRRLLIDLATKENLEGYEKAIGVKTLKSLQDVLS